MNKELEALKEIESISERITFNEKHKLGKVDYQWIKEIVCKNTKTIETALKEQDKNKKAIEIIKETVLINVIEMQGQYFIKLGIGENVIPITKEKALILKEALL